MVGNISPQLCTWLHEVTLALHRLVSVKNSSLNPAVQYNQFFEISSSPKNTSNIGGVLSADPLRVDHLLNGVEIDVPVQLLLLIPITKTELSLFKTTVNAVQQFETSVFSEEGAIYDVFDFDRGNYINQEPPTPASNQSSFQHG